MPPTYTFDPSFLSIPEEKLAESAALQLRNCPALQAFLVRRHEFLAEGYDKARDMEKIREIRGRRKELSALLRLVLDNTSRKTLVSLDDD